MRRALIFPYVIFVVIIYIYVFAFCLCLCAVSGVSDSPISDVSRIAREKPDFG